MIYKKIKINIFFLRLEEGKNCLIYRYSLMAKFKFMKEIVLFYTDKDSIDINKSLNKKFIGKELGLMKLEHIFNVWRNKIFL